jgi:DNA-binding MarR family transcriptional regulator
MSESSPFKHASPDDSPGFLLWKVTGLWQKKLAVILNEFGITQTQYAILASLKWFDEQGELISQSHIAAHAKIDKMTLSKAIRKLGLNGLVSRERSAVDNRAVTIRLLPKGKALVKHAVVAIENADDSFFACLTDGELSAYKTLAIKIISNNNL